MLRLTGTLAGSWVFGLAGPVDLGLVERMKLHPRAAAFAVETREQIAGDVVPAHPPVDRLDLLQALLRRAAPALNPRLQRPVSEGEADLAGDLASAIGTGQAVQASEQPAP